MKILITYNIAQLLIREKKPIFRWVKSQYKELKLEYNNINFDSENEIQSIKGIELYANKRDYYSVAYKMK